MKSRSRRRSARALPRRGIARGARRRGKAQKAERGSRRAVVHFRPIPRPYGRHNRSRCQHRDRSRTSRHRRAVAILSPRRQVVAPDEMRLRIHEYHHAGAERLQRCFETHLPTMTSHPFTVNLPVDAPDWNKAAVLDRIALEPSRLECDICCTPTSTARSMSRRERSRLVEEEQLGIGTAPHDRAPPPAEFEPAGHPRLAIPASSEQRPADGVVNHSAIPHQGATSGGGDDFARRPHSVL